jgi:hypothetical protein
MTIIGAAKAALSHFKVAPFNANRLAIEQGIGYLSPRAFQDAMEGGARDMHSLRTLLLLQSFQILKANRFYLLDRKTYLFYGRERNPHRSKISYLR